MVTRGRLEDRDRGRCVGNHRFSQSHSAVQKVDCPQIRQRALVYEGDDGGTSRRRAIDYHAVVADLKARGVEYRDEALKAPPTPSFTHVRARDYQSEAVESGRSWGIGYSRSPDWRGEDDMPEGDGRLQYRRSLVVPYDLFSWTVGGEY